MHQSTTLSLSQTIWPRWKSRKFLSLPIVQTLLFVTFYILRHYELIGYILLWTPSHGRAKAWWPARAYKLQLCADTGYSREDLLGAMDDRDGWRERVRNIRADGVTWWWWLCIVCSPNLVEFILFFKFFGSRLKNQWFLLSVICFFLNVVIVLKSIQTLWYVCGWFCVASVVCWDIC